MAEARSRTGAGVESVTVWQAPKKYRQAATVASVLLVVLIVLVIYRFGLLQALLGVALVTGGIVATWWNLIRPKLTAGPDGVDVITGRTPVHLKWQQIRRCEPTREGLKIILANGREVLSRFPQQFVAAASTPTEADVAAAYLAQRAAWARKPTGPVPTYTPPPAPAKPGRK